MDPIPICPSISSMVSEGLETNANNFNLLSHRTALFAKKPSYAGSRFFNLLPDELKNLRDFTFRRHLRRWFVQRPFYAVNEFLSNKPNSTSLTQHVFEI
ncbi:hypothetical protein J6590_101006 [Homalodisca vitripennis]|nr:hypothetical protein J6590_101006 [Homalodisca vitripennis]